MTNKSIAFSNIYSAYYCYYKRCKTRILAEFYLNMNRTYENALYHEAHSHVAVMFATLTDLSIDERNILEDFNEIICQFDKLLFEPYYICRIEKIKIAGQINVFRLSK